MFLKIEFQDDRSINVGAVGGRNCLFPLTMAHRIYNSLFLPHNAVCVQCLTWPAPAIGLQ